MCIHKHSENNTSQNCPVLKGQLRKKEISLDKDSDMGTI